MLLCDIGNTSLHFYDGERDFKCAAKGFDPSTFTEEVIYISVNPMLESRLNLLANWKDLRGYIEWENYYETMGVDRIAACESIDEGVIIDAGSALTVDVVKGGRFQGGFIYPGINAMKNAYLNISSRLDYSFNFELDLDKMPKNSRDAISYGYLRTLYSEVMRHSGPYYLTGGDAERFRAVFPSAIIDRHLIFRGMQKIMEKGTLC